MHLRCLTSSQQHMTFLDDLQDIVGHIIDQHRLIVPLILKKNHLGDHQVLLWYLLYKFPMHVHFTSLLSRQADLVL